MKKWLKKFFHSWLRKIFCENEVKKGMFLVVWRDVDDKVYGWTMKADHEERLLAISKIVRRAKVRKLENITGMSREDSEALP